MKRICKIFFIIILALTINTFFYKTNKIVTEKKKVEKEYIIRGKYGPLAEIYFYQYISKYDENNNPLSGLRFKLSTYNEIYSKYSDRNIEGNEYEISGEIEGEEYFEQSKNILSTEQKNVVDFIATTDDFNKINNGKHVHCENYYEEGEYDASNPQRRRKTGAYCYIPLPTIFYVEEIVAPEGYAKDKVIVPGELELTYYVDGYQVDEIIPEEKSPSKREDPDGDYYTLASDYFGSNKYSVELVGIRDTSLDYGYYLNFGDVNIKELVGLNIDKAWDIWENNTSHLECNHQLLKEQSINIQNIPTYYNFRIQKEIKQNQTSENINKRRFLNNECEGITLHNHKGEVKLEAKSYVNGKEEISTSKNTKVNYKVVVKNIGTADAVDTIVTSKLPDGFIYVENSATNEGIYENGVISWRIDKISKDHEIDFSYQAYGSDDTNQDTQYIGEVSVNNFAMPQKVEVNKTIVRLNLENPITSTPGVIIIIILCIGIAFTIYQVTNNKKKKTKKEEKKKK